MKKIINHWIDGRKYSFVWKILYRPFQVLINEGLDGFFRRSFNILRTKKYRFIRRLLFFFRKLPPFIQGFIFKSHLRSKIFFRVKPKEAYAEHMKLINRNILLEKHNAVYFYIPKVACTSIKYIYADILGLKPNPEKPIHKIPFPFVKKADLKKYNSYLKFAFVRNPWDKLVSCYFDKVKRDKNLNDANFKGGVDRNFLTYGAFKQNMSFKEFVYIVNNIPEEIANGHFRSQYRFITDINGKLKVDFIGRFENLEEDFKRVCQKIGLPNIKLPHHYKNIDRKGYREYYDQETRALVKERYRKDIEMFGYKF